MPKCWWFVRIWHRQLQRLDLKILWPIICEKAPSIEARNDAWALHVAMDGQRHWRCACAFGRDPRG